MDEKAKQIARASANELKSSHGEGIVLEVERAILNDGSARQSKTYIPIEPTAELAIFICECAIAAVGFVYAALSKTSTKPTQEAVERHLRVNVTKPGSITAKDQQRVNSQAAEKALQG